MRAVTAKSSASRRAHSTRAPVSSSTPMIAASRAAAGGCAPERGLLLTGERVGPARPRDADPLDGYAEARLLVHGGQTK